MWWATNRKGEIIVANTINPTAGSDIDKFIEITGIDSDWTWTDTFKGAHNGIAVDFIAYSSGDADGDICVIKEASDTGPAIFPKQAQKTQGPAQIVYYGCSIKPVIDYGDCTLSTGHSIVIKLKG